MKLTDKMLRQIIEEEAGKFGKERDVEDAPKDTEEVDADEYGEDSTLEKKIDYVKALKIEETRMRKRWKRIQAEKRRVVESIIKGA